MQTSGIPPPCAVRACVMIPLRSTRTSRQPVLKSWKAPAREPEKPASDAVRNWPNGTRWAYPLHSKTRAKDGVTKLPDVRSQPERKRRQK